MKNLNLRNPIFMSQGFCNARVFQFQFLCREVKRIILVFAHRYCV